MDKAMEIPIPRPIPTEAPKRPHSALRRRALAGILALGEIAAVVGLVNQNQTTNVGVDNKTDVTPAPKSPDHTFTVSPTPKEPPTASPTPETPKYAYWSAEKVADTQNAAAANGQEIFLDTMTPKGIKLVDASTYNDHSILVASGFKEGQTFDSPMGGKIDSISTLPGTIVVKKVWVRNGQVVVTFYLDAENDIFVKPGDEIKAGTPIAKMTGKLLPQDLGFSQRGQIVIADQTDNTSIKPITLEKNILKDGGLTVQIQK